MSKSRFVNHQAPPIDADFLNALQEHVHDGADKDGSAPKVDAVAHVHWGEGASIESLPAGHADAANNMPTLALRGRGLFAGALKALTIHVKNILLVQDGSTPVLKIRHLNTEEDNVTLDVHKVQAAKLESTGLIQARNVPIALAIVGNAGHSEIFPDVIFGNVEDYGRGVRCVGAKHMVAIPIGGAGTFNVHVTKKSEGTWTWDIEGVSVGVKLQLLFF